MNTTRDKYPFFWLNPIVPASVRIASAGALLGASILLTACSTNRDLTRAQALYRAGSVNEAASVISGLAGKEEIGGRDSEIVFIEQGSILATAGDSDGANKAFINADRAISRNDDKAKVRLASEAGALLTNLNSRPYRASPTERIMSAAYLAVTFAENESLTQARSAVKLAKNRQKEIFAIFEKDIERDIATKKQAEKSALSALKQNDDATPSSATKTPKKSSSHASGFAALGSFNPTSAFGQLLSKQKSPTVSGGAMVKQDTGTKTKSSFKLDNEKVASKQAELLQDVANYTGYNNYRVPYAEALAGVLLGCGASPEQGRACESFANALSCHSSSAHLKRSKNGAISGRTHVFIEDGVAPVLSSVRIDIPLQIDGAVTTFSAAFPRFEVQALRGSLASLSVDSNVVECNLICDFDRLAALEYKKKLPGTIARTVASSTLKAVAGIAAQKGAEGNADVKNLLKIASVVYNVASAKADQRIWATLPKQVRYACVSTPSSGEIRIGGEKVKLPTGQSNLVIARVINGKVHCRVISL